MIQLGFFSLIVGLALVAGTSTRSVQAAAITKSHQIKITATVLPAQTVIIDDSGQIMKVVANSTKTGVVPTVYENEVTTENIRPLNSELSQSLAKLLKTVTVKPGVLYDSATKADYTAKPEKGAILRLFSSKISHLKQ